jgi:hypothetical protein
MNRRTLDVVLPMVYAAAIVGTAMLASGTATSVVAALGAILLGAYYAGIRRNLT